MNRFVKIIFSFAMATIICLSMTACGQEPYPEYESGYFKYAVKTEKGGEQKAYIIGLTKTGLEQTVLVYPEEIEGIPVYGIGYATPVASGHLEVGALESERLQKFYFPCIPKESDKGSINFDNAYVLYWSLSADVLSNRVHGFGKGAIFGYNYVENDYWIYDYSSRFIGNVSYLYNYDGSPNDGYYWVDSYDERAITFIPPEPQRDGYIFNGWYKESECINKWDFSVDVTGKKIMLEHNKNHNVYEGVYLYAKWVENKNEGE